MLLQSKSVCEVSLSGYNQSVTALTLLWFTTTEPTDQESYWRVDGGTRLTTAGWAADRQAVGGAAAGDSH